MPPQQASRGGVAAFAAAAPRELLEFREEASGFNTWLKDELSMLSMRFSDVDRKLDMLDLTNCLQERLLAQFMEMDKRLETIGSQLVNCEASLITLKNANNNKVDFRAKSKLWTLSETSAASERQPSSAPEPRRGSITSIESLNQASGLFDVQSPWKEGVSEFLDNPDSGRCAYIYSNVWPVFVMVTAVLTLVQTFGTVFWTGIQAAVTEVVIDSLFWLEVFLRCFSYSTTCGFFKSAYNIIDILAALPLFLRVAVGVEAPDDGFARFTLLCWVPLLRGLKLLRWLKQFHLFARVFENTWEALKFLLFLLFLIVLLFASLFYLVEPRTNVVSFPQAMWYTIVTVTTVGYTPPETEAGHVVLTCLLISSVLYMAMPIGILGNAFTEIWKDRDFILLASRTEDRLCQWGYTAADLPQIFALFDHEGKGELSVFEFRNMLTSMRIGISDDRTVEVFNMLDSDDGGSIDHKEFLKRLFPKTYYELYGSKRTTKASAGREKLKRQGTQAVVSSAQPSPTGTASPTGMSGSPTGMSVKAHLHRAATATMSRTSLASSSNGSAGADPDGHPGAKV